MSIINDALKKAQQNLEKKKSNTDPYDIINNNQNNSNPNTPEVKNTQEEHTVQTVTEEKNTTERNKILITIAITIFLVGLLSFLAITTFKQLGITTSKPNKTKESSPSDVKELKTKNYIASMKSKLTLQGTMMMGKKRVALINGEVYSLGETINGLEIINIQLASTDLKDSDGNTITIGVKK